MADITLPPEIDVFIEKLISDGFGASPPANKEGLKQELLNQLDAHIITRVAQALPTDRLTQFTTMVEQGLSDEAQQEYLSTHVPEYAKVCQDALAEFYHQYVPESASLHKVE